VVIGVTLFFGFNIQSICYMKHDLWRDLTKPSIGHFARTTLSHFCGTEKGLYGQSVRCLVLSDRVTFFEHPHLQLNNHVSALPTTEICIKNEAFLVIGSTAFKIFFVNVAIWSPISGGQQRYKFSATTAHSSDINFQLRLQVPFSFPVRFNTSLSTAESVAEKCDYWIQCQSQRFKIRLHPQLVQI